MGRCRASDPAIWSRGRRRSSIWTMPPRRPPFPHPRCRRPDRARPRQERRRARSTARSAARTRSSQPVRARPRQERRCARSIARSAARTRIGDTTPLDLPRNRRRAIRPRRRPGRFQAQIRRRLSRRPWFRRAAALPRILCPRQRGQARSTSRCRSSPLRPPALAGRSSWSQRRTAPAVSGSPAGRSRPRRLSRRASLWAQERARVRPAPSVTRARLPHGRRRATPSRPPTRLDRATARGRRGKGGTRPPRLRARCAGPQQIPHRRTRPRGRRDAEANQRRTRTTTARIRSG